MKVPLVLIFENINIKTHRTSYFQTHKNVYGFSSHRYKPVSCLEECAVYIQPAVLSEDQNQKWGRRGVENDNSQYRGMTRAAGSGLGQRVMVVLSVGAEIEKSFDCLEKR